MVRPWVLLSSGRDFRWLWAGGLTSSIGDSLTSFALMAVLYSLTGSTSAIAALYALALVPSLLVSLPAGVFIDHHSRRHVMIAADLIRAGLVAALVFTDNPRVIYCLYAAVSVGNQFFEPARNALLPQIVPSDRYLAANALMLFNLELARVVGPALAGWLVAVWGPKSVFGADAATFVLSALAVACVVGRAGETALGRQRSWLELRQGMGHLVGSPPVRRCTLVNLGAWLVAGASPVVVYSFGREALGIGDAGAGLLLSAMGTGMIVGSAALSGSRAPSGDRWRLLSGSLALSGVFIVLLGLASSLWWAVAWRFLLGWSWVVYRAASVALLQEIVPDELRGRAFAAYNGSLIAAMILSFIGLGRLTDLWGPRPTVLAMGLWLVTLGLLVAAAQRRWPGRARAEVVR